MDYKWTINGRKASKKGSNFASENKKGMSLLGGIGLFAAIANYKKCKKEYDAAKAEANDAAVMAAIEQYDNSKWNKLDEYDKTIYDPNASFKGLLPVPIVNVGMLAGEKCRVKPQCVLKNIGDETITIYQFATVIKLLGEPFIVANSENRFRITIRPKEQVTITMPLPTSEALVKKFIYGGGFLTSAVAESLLDVWGITAELKEIKQKLINATKTYKIDVKTILDVPENSVISNVLTADVEIMYNTEGNKDIRRALYHDCKGTLVYKSEHYYPGGGKWIVE